MTTPLTLIPGNYSVTETVPDGWTLDASDCLINGASQNTTQNITVEGGDFLHCIFDNTKKVDLFCDDMTIDQLIASGNYNVIDNRNGTDVMPWGTPENDLILSVDSVRMINARDGDDCIIGTDSKEYILGGNGNDQIYALGGNDVIYGMNGDDIIFGGDGNDVISGGPGNNTIDGGPGKNRIR